MSKHLKQQKRCIFLILFDAGCADACVHQPKGWQTDRRSLFLKANKLPLDLRPVPQSLVVCSWCARGARGVLVCAHWLSRLSARAAFVACSCYARVSFGFTLLTPIPYCDCRLLLPRCVRGVLAARRSQPL
jgi:hypothetical protein